MNKHNTSACRRQQGAYLVMFGGLLLLLTGFAVLAIDIGRIFIVRSELQNVADAAALSGANCLTRQSGLGTTDCSTAMATTLNWTRATANAQAQLSQNQADNRSISSSDGGHVITAGYWNLLTRSASGGSLSTTFSPLTTYDKPAISVKVSKGTGQNGGPIVMLTRLMFGGSDVPMSATAVAVISSPGSVISGSLIPMVINQCLYDKYWNSSTNMPVTALNNTAINGVPQVSGQAVVFRIGSSYHYGSCDSGQWTSFGVNSNAASDVAGLITNGNSTALSIGDATYIQSGTKTSNFDDLKVKIGQDVLVAVVNYPTGLDSVSTSIPIVAFAMFHITDVQGGSGKYMEGYFKNGLSVSGSSGIGPSYGSYTPPRLAY